MFFVFDCIRMRCDVQFEEKVENLNEDERKTHMWPNDFVSFRFNIMELMKIDTKKQ